MAPLVVGLGFQWEFYGGVLLFGRLLRPQGGACVIWPCAAVGHALLLGGLQIRGIPTREEWRLKFSS